MRAGWRVVAFRSWSFVALETTEVTVYLPWAWLRLTARRDVENERSSPVWNWYGTLAFTGSFAPNSRLACGTMMSNVASNLSRAWKAGFTLSTRSVSVVRQPAPV